MLVFSLVFPNFALPYFFYIFLLSLYCAVSYFLNWCPYASNSSNGLLGSFVTHGFWLNIPDIFRQACSIETWQVCLNIARVWIVLMVFACVHFFFKICKNKVYVLRSWIKSVSRELWDVFFVFVFFLYSEWTRNQTG